VGRCQSDTISKLIFTILGEFLVKYERTVSLLTRLIQAFLKLSVPFPLSGGGVASLRNYRILPIRVLLGRTFRRNLPTEQTRRTRNCAGAIPSDKQRRRI
jgi:hypothetical protein